MDDKIVICLTTSCNAAGDTFSAMTSAKHAAMTMLALTALSAPARRAGAQTAVQIVKFEVRAINRIAVSGSPTLTIHRSAGQATATTTSNGGTWSVTTNQTGAKVTASLAAPMPEGLTLSLALTAPAGATSAGLEPLSTTPVDVVTHLSQLSAANLPMTYQLAADAAGTSVSGTRAVTLTITGGA
jgi:hypothetical protein